MQGCNRKLKSEHPTVSNLRILVPDILRLAGRTSHHTTATTTSTLVRETLRNETLFCFIVFVSYRLFFVKEIAKHKRKCPTTTNLRISVPGTPRLVGRERTNPYSYKLLKKLQENITKYERTKKREKLKMCGIPAVTGLLPGNCSR